MRKVFLENLPKNNNKTINWKETIGYNVKFIYDNIQGKIKIIEYNNKKHNLLVKYLNNDYKILTNSLKHCKINTLINNQEHDFKVKIGTIFKDNMRDLLIIGKKHMCQKCNNQNRKYYKYKCNKCGYEGWIEESNLLKHKTGCSCCCSTPRKVAEGINDIPTTAPWMVKYFQGGYDEAKLYTYGSGKKIYPICPDCGRVKNKPMSISSLYENHSIFCSCNDNKSYPEKFMYNVLEQLKTDFIYQSTKVNFDWCNKYMYDFYFEYNNEPYIIETHGLQHYKTSFKKIKGARTLEEEQNNDKLKKELALNNGIKEENYIIIDCRKSELEFIKNNILHSKLNILFNLNNINWMKCHEFALSNLVKIACNYKKNNPNITTKEISEIMKLARNTICRYLKQGTKLGWCEYNPKDEIEKNNKTFKARINKANSKPIILYTKEGIYIGKFNSAKELQDVSKQKMGILLKAVGILKVCRKERKQYKGFVAEFINK